MAPDRPRWGAAALLAMAHGVPGLVLTLAASHEQYWRRLPFCRHARRVNDRKSAPSRLKKLGGGFLLAVVLAAVCRSNRRDSDTSATPRTIVARTADVADGAPSPKPATPERTTAEPLTVRQYIAASPADQEKALRARWVTNAAEPTLGKLISAARETGAENDTVLGIKHCVDGLVRNDAKVLGVFKNLGITDAHLMQEPERAVNDAIDTCMVMMMAMAANTGS